MERDEFGDLSPPKPVWDAGIPCGIRENIPFIHEKEDECTSVHLMRRMKAFLQDNIPMESPACASHASLPSHFPLGMIGSAGDGGENLKPRIPSSQINDRDLGESLIGIDQNPYQL